MAQGIHRQGADGETGLLAGIKEGQGLDSAVRDPRDPSKTRDSPGSSHTHGGSQEHLLGGDPLASHARKACSQACSGGASQQSRLAPEVVCAHWISPTQLIGPSQR